MEFVGVGLLMLVKKIAYKIELEVHQSHVVSILKANKKKQAILRNKQTNEIKKVEKTIRSTSFVNQH